MTFLPCLWAVLYLLRIQIFSASASRWGTCSVWQCQYKYYITCIYYLFHVFAPIHLSSGSATNRIISSRAWWPLRIPTVVPYLPYCCWLFDSSDILHTGTWSRVTTQLLTSGFLVVLMENDTPWLRLGIERLRQDCIVGWVIFPLKKKKCLITHPCSNLNGQCKIHQNRADGSRARKEHGCTTWVRGTRAWLRGLSRRLPLTLVNLYTVDSATSTKRDCLVLKLNDLIF